MAYEPPTMQRIREVATWKEADSPAGNHALNCLESLLAEHDRMLADYGVLMEQRDALLELCRALDEIAYGEGQGFPELEAKVIALGLDPRCDLLREGSDG